MVEVGTVLGTLVRAVTAFVVGALVFAVVQHLFRTRSSAPPGGGAALSLVCGARVLSGEERPLSRWLRVGRAVVTRGRIELRLYRWNVRLLRVPAATIDVVAVDRSSVRRAGWRHSLNTAASTRLVTVTSAGGALVELALPTDDVDAVLDVLEGLPIRGPDPAGSPDLPALDELPDLPHGWAWPTDRTVQVTSRTPVDRTGSALHAEDVVAQLDLYLRDVQEQLTQQRMPLAGLERLQIRTTDAHAVGASVAALAQWLRTTGATPTITVLAVERLTAPGQVVELDATARTT